MIYEFKDADKQYALKGQELETLFRQAVRQNKEPRFVVHFRSVGLTAEIHLHRERL